MVATPTTQLGQFSTPNGAVPCEGTKAYPFNLDFTGGKNAYSIDLTQQYNQKQFTTLQCIYADNSANTAPLQIVCSATGQVITFPPMSQGYLPILQPVPPKFIIQTTGGVVIMVQLLNFYVPPTIWNIATYSGSGLPQIDIPALDAIISNGRLNVSSRPATDTFVDKSGTITAGGTGQVLVPVAAAGQRVLIQNPSTAGEVLQYSLIALVGPWFDLAAGQAVDLSEITNGVWVKGATTAHAFTAASSPT